MQITLNNKSEQIPDRAKMTIGELLQYKDFTFKFLVVRVNGKNVRPGEYDSTQVTEGDNVQVIHLISGG